MITEIVGGGTMRRFTTGRETILDQIASNRG
jgi:hypothetical protein